jgi:hypothetical protein
MSRSLVLLFLFFQDFVLGLLSGCPSDDGVIEFFEDLFLLYFAAISFLCINQSIQVLVERIMVQISGNAGTGYLLAIRRGKD